MCWLVGKVNVRIRSKNNNLDRRSVVFRRLPLFEIRIHHTIRETFTTNTNTFEYTVTGELVHHQVRIDDTFSLEMWNSN